MQRRSRPDAHRRPRRRLLVGARRRLRRRRHRRSPATRTSPTPIWTPIASSTRAAPCSRRSARETPLAISCFWHSLVAVDERDRPLTPVLTWRDLAGGEPPPLDAEAYHRRTGCFLHPAYWPAKIRRLEAEGLRPARYLSFGDSAARSADRRGAHERLDRERHRALRSLTLRLGRRDARRARPDAGSTRAALRRAGCRRLSCARRRRVLERRCRLRDARTARR